MHRPTAGLALAASLMSMMKSVGSVAAAAAKSSVAVDDFNQALLSAAPVDRGPLYPHPNSAAHRLKQMSQSPSFDYIRRQRIKMRWENGLPVDKEDAAALEAAAARRAPILARRAKMYASGMKAVA